MKITYNSLKKAVDLTVIRPRAKHILSLLVMPYDKDYGYFRSIQLLSELSGYTMRIVFKELVYLKDHLRVIDGKFRGGYAGDMIMYKFNMDVLKKMELEWFTTDRDYCFQIGNDELAKGFKYEG